MRTSREACSGWGGVELSFLGATLHVSTHAPSTYTDSPTMRAGPVQEVPAAGAVPPSAPPGIVGQLPRVRRRTPGLPRRSFRRRGRAVRLSMRRRPAESDVANMTGRESRWFRSQRISEPVRPFAAVRSSTRLAGNRAPGRRKADPCSRWADAVRGPRKSSVRFTGARDVPRLQDRGESQAAQPRRAAPEPPSTAAAAARC